MTLNLATLLRESASRFPDRAALISGERTVSYEQLHDAAWRFATALESLGISRGRHVALLLPNVPEFCMRRR